MIQFKPKGLCPFIHRLGKAANGEVEKEFSRWLETVEVQFLEEIQREITRAKAVDTRRLLKNFNRGGTAKTWRISQGGLTLKVDTNETYARWINHGHRVTTKGDNLFILR